MQTYPIHKWLWLLCLWLCCATNMAQHTDSVCADKVSVDSGCVDSGRTNDVHTNKVHVDSGRVDNVRTDNVRRAGMAVENVMRLTYTYAAREGLSVGSYQATAYIRTNVHTHRRNGLMRYVPGYFALSPGYQHYVNEMQIALSYRFPNLVDRKVLASHGNVPRDIQQRERLMAHYSISPYGKTLWRSFALSPFHRDNARYYRYHLDSVATDSVGQPWAYVGIRPKVNNAQLVRGQAIVQAYTGAIRVMHLEVYYDLTRVRLSARMGTAGAERLLPHEVSVETRLNFMGNRVTTSGECLYHYTAIISRPNYLLDEADRSAEEKRSVFDHSHAFAHRLDTTAIVRHMAYFDSVRPRPLPEPLRHRLEAHEQQQPTPHTSTKRTRLWRGVERILFDGPRFAHYDSTGTRTAELRLPPIINPEGIRWSHSRGLFILTKWQGYWQLSPTMYLRTTAHVGYNFRAHEWQSVVPIEWQIDTRRNISLRLEGGKYQNLYTTDQFKAVASALHPHLPYDTLMHIINSVPYHDYRNYQAHLSASGDLWPGLNVAGGINYYHRQLKHYDATARSYGLHPTLRTLALSAQLTWTPALHYYRDERQRYDLYSRWPTLFVSYEQSIRTLGLHANYARIEGNVSYRYRLNAVKSVYFRLGGGGFIKKENSYFTDFAFFNNNPLRHQLDDDMMGHFQLLNGRWYNLSAYYTQGSVAYESPMLLLSRIGSLSRLIHTERLYLNVLHSALLRPYIEVGYGIRTPLLDVGVFVSGAKGKALSTGISFEYRLFDGWGR